MEGHVKERPGLWLFFALFAVAAAVFSAYGQTVITYLPRNEKITSEAKNYTSLTLFPISCDAGNDFFNNASDCNYCVEYLKKYCDDCCLNVTEDGTEYMLCGDNDTTTPPCVRQIFDAWNCTTVACGNYESDMQACSNTTAIPGCQRKGCPVKSPPDTRLGGSCVHNATKNAWFCDRNDLQPIDSDDKPEPQWSCFQQFASHAGFPPTYSYYTVNPADPLTDTECPGPICYNYTMTPAFENALAVCPAQADAIERCQKSKGCCSSPVCVDQKKTCDRDACQQRLAIDRCYDPRNPENEFHNCAGSTRSGTKCLSQGDCKDCFELVDPELFHEFVAKSGESLTVIWQMSTQPVIGTNSIDAMTHFFTRLIVTDDRNETVYRSIVHQKALETASSIFCAAQVPASVFQPGHSYIVRLTYFLPLLTDEDISIRVNNIRMIYIKIRK